MSAKTLKLRKQYQKASSRMDNALNTMICDDSFWKDKWIKMVDDCAGICEALSKSMLDDLARRAT